MTEPDKKRIRLWDAPVRIIHWSFVLLIPALWWTAEDLDVDLHIRLGLAMLALVTFRLAWGVAGSDTARFSQFVKGPGSVLSYLKSGGATHSVPGHNPLGGWSVLVLLGLLGLQIGLGLIAQDEDGLSSGPLNHFVSFETAEAAREWHEAVFNLLVAMVVLHVGAILFHRIVKRDNLIHPMLSGMKEVDEAVKEPGRATPLAALACLIVAMAFTSWIARGAPLL